MFYMDMFPFLLGIYLGVEMLDHLEVTSITSEELFCKGVLPFYISSSSV